MNRNKRSITVDLQTPEGVKIIHGLLPQCDVVVQNFKTGGAEKLGLGYEQLKAIKPDLIYCSVAGYDSSGPEAKRPGYDLVIQGESGLMALNGEANTPPLKFGVAVVDLMTGMYATVSILAAVAEREKSGLGQHVDMALLDTQVAMTANMSMNYLATGKAPVRSGNAHSNIVPYQTFAAADGHIILAVGNDSQFIKLCAVGGRPELATDARFSTNPARVKHRDVLVPLLEQMFAKQPMAFWSEQLEGVGVPCGAINNLQQVYDDPQVQARGMRIELPHPTAGTVPLVGSPIKLSRTPVEYRTAPPMLGEHTGEVLGSLLGYSDDEIAAL
ncbi:MAG: CoA transferase, partial [Burkholderiales bacterium 12-64-5]